MVPSRREHALHPSTINHRGQELQVAAQNIPEVGGGVCVNGGWDGLVRAGLGWAGLGECYDRHGWQAPHMGRTPPYLIPWPPISLYLYNYMFI